MFIRLNNDDDDQDQDDDQESFVMDNGITWLINNFLKIKILFCKNIKTNDHHVNTHQ